MIKEKADLVIEKANELITLCHTNATPIKKERMQNLGIIKSGSIAIRNGKIISVGNARTIKHKFKPKRIIDASGKTVMPGFVDSHTHLIFAGSREEEFKKQLQGASYLEILEKGGGILSTVRETRKASKAELVSSGRKTLDVMLKHGTTTVEAKSGYGLTTKDEIKCLQTMKELSIAHPIDIVPTFLGAHALPIEYAGKSDEYVSLVTDEMIPAITERRLAEFCDVFCEKGAFDFMQSKKILLKGKKCGLKLKIHADELTNQNGAELAAEVGCVSAEHLLFSSETGLKAMAKKGVIAILLPAASFSLSTKRFANAKEILELGVPMALGTDFNPICWTENMQEIITLACRLMHIAPAEAIVASTINAAYAIDRGQEVGSLEKGKKADIIVLDIPNHEHLGYRFGVNLVDKVVKGGCVVVD
ncbi:MAG: imidazolonepropionase [Candidatus Bathyarchaeota archaeon]|nr:MAG: imidazolonepropionase [Candidatus Bathyarchaeota archaeon]